MWDYAWPTGSSTGLIRYPRDTVTVWLENAALQLTSAGGETSMLAVEPGEMRHTEAGTVEQMDIVAGPPRAIVFELK